MFSQGFHERSQGCISFKAYYILSIFHMFNLTYVLVVLQHHDESETGLIYMYQLILTTVSRDVC